MMSRAGEIRRFMSGKLAYISAIADQGEGKAVLAALRKGLGHAPGEIPEVLGLILEDMPESFMSKGTKPTDEEWACYTALTLFAMHQQGNEIKTRSMHTEKPISIGSAMSMYAAVLSDANAKKRMAVKLKALSTSKDAGELSYHLKSVIQLLKTEGIALNYSRLASDIYEFQFPDARSGICLKWGQDFYRSVKNETDEKEE